MTPAQFRAALETLDMSVNDFARAIGINSRNAARYCDDRGEGPSPSAEYCIRAMLAFKRIATIHKRHPDAIHADRLVGDEYETGLLDAQEIAARALKGEFYE